MQKYHIITDQIPQVTISRRDPVYPSSPQYNTMDDFPDLPYEIQDLIHEETCTTDSPRLAVMNMKLSDEIILSPGQIDEFNPVFSIDNSKHLAKTDPFRTALATCTRSRAAAQRVLSREN